MKKNNNKKGFTLVEIMVVVSIIAFLSSIVSFRLVQAKAKAQDTSRVATTQQLRTAVLSYKLDHNGVAPPLPGGVSVPINDSDPAFATTLAPLIAGKYISQLPSGLGIFYFNDSGQNTIVGTTLVTGQQTTTGSGGSCRPFTAAGATVQGPTIPPGVNATSCSLAASPPGQMICQSCAPVCNPTCRVVCNYLPQTYPTQCADGLDNDGDSAIDTADTGCASLTDNGESPNPATAPPYCSNSLNSDYCLCM